MSRIKTHVKKGDLVVVISGAHKGAQGTVLEVQPAKGRVLIEGVRMIKKTVRPSQDKPQGGIIEKEGPIHISNVKLVEKKTAKKDADAKPEKKKKKVEKK
ncbi:MAG: 50S ribosomal protein L24 [Verrucomicrobiaceae bacterium]|nr:50S ribosomal protein L24 [Verrucomicrobiaceae bacterium]